MDKPLDLLDFINLNKESDYSSKELKNFIMIHGSLEYNIKKHIRLLNKIPEINRSRKNNKWHTSRSFHLLMRKIQEIESRIDKYISLMFESEFTLPEIAHNYTRLKDLVDYIDRQSSSEKSPMVQLENQKKKLEKLTLTNDALWAIADDMRERKEEGEFETYMDAYRWAAKNISKKDVIITAKGLERAYHKAKSEGKIL